MGRNSKRKRSQDDEDKMERYFRKMMKAAKARRRRRSSSSSSSLTSFSESDHRYDRDNEADPRDVGDSGADSDSGESSRNKSMGKIN